jgi:hypothetical protein
MVLRTLGTRLFRASDHERWSDLENHDITWDNRTRGIADLVPAGSHVIEFGAGRCQLRQWLPNDCTYLASDIVHRGSGTWICDLNRRPLPPLGRKAALQVAVFGGVLEYVVDLPSVLVWLAPHVDCVIASYSCAPPSDTRAKRFRVSAARLSAGWVNSFTQAELTACFNDASYELTKSAAVRGERDEHIYLFTSCRRPACA